MPNFDIESIVRLLPDKQAANQAIALVDKLRKGLENVKRASLDNTAVRGFKRYVDGLKEANREAEKLAARVKETRDAAGSVGDIGDRLSVLGRVSGVQGLGGAGEIAETLEALTLFKSGLKELPGQLADVTRAIGGGSLIGGAGVIAGVVALTLVLQELQRQQDASIAAAQKNIDLQAQLNELREEATATDIKPLLEDAEERLQDGLREVDIAQPIVDQYLAGINNKTVRERMRAAFESVIAGGALDPLSRLTLPANLVAALDTLQKQTPIIQQARTDIAGYQELLQDSNVQTRTAAEAEDELAAARERSTNALNQAILAATLEAKQLDAGQLRQRIQSISDEFKALDRAIATGQFTGEALKSASDRLHTLAATIGIFRDALPKAETTENAQAFIQGIKDIGKTLFDTNKEINAINDRYYEDRAALEQKTADALVSIAEKAAEAAEDALRDLQQQQDDLQRDLGRGDRDAQRQAAIDELNLRIEAQREEARAYRAHVRDLERIRNQAADRELELEANRDFRSLFFSRRETTRALSEASKTFREEQRERKIAYGQQRADLAAQIQQEREQRLQQYADQLEDAQLQYNRQLEQADIQEKREIAKANAQAAKELALLNSKHAKELAARGAAIGNELNAIYEGGKRIVDIRKAALLAEAAIVSQGGIAGILSSLFQRRQSGGFLGAGQPSSVNEGTNQRESFNGSLLPDGKGLFIPFKSGQVDSRGRGGRSVVLNQNVSINGSGLNEGRIVALVEQRTEQLLKRTFL